MKILITGAQFGNKGAQSLLFTVMDQLRRQDADTEIYYTPVDNYKSYAPDHPFRFHLIFGGRDAHRYETHPELREEMLANQAERRKQEPTALAPEVLSGLHRLLPQLDGVLDVSGYALTSKMADFANRRLLWHIAEAARYGIPVILLPQSFGPFHYAGESADLPERIRETLPLAARIYAREPEGYQLLTEEFGLSNVRQAPDLVLQTEPPDWRNLMTREPDLRVPRLETTGNVGVIPNTQTFLHGDERAILSLYRELLAELIRRGRQIWIFRHSEDLEPCKAIAALFPDHPQVHLVEEEFSCFGYSVFVRQFDYIIASRFHAVVHAYREGIPAVIPGWAVKYRELAALLGQEAYAFDITERFDPRDLLRAVERMDERFREERDSIAAGISRLRKHNCFPQCWEILERAKKERRC